jgi:hypothetical protein
MVLKFIKRILGKKENTGDLENFKIQAEKILNTPVKIDKRGMSDENNFSRVIMEFASPVLEKTDDINEKRIIIGVAAACWNLSFLEEEKRKKAIQDFLTKLEARTPETRKSLLENVRFLIKRKKDFFPDDKRILMGYEISGEREELKINVVFSDPEQAKKRRWEINESKKEKCKEKKKYYSGN